MHQASYSVTVNKPIEVVFSFVADGEKCLNRTDFSGDSGLPWVWWSRVAGNQATVAVLCRVSNSTGVSMPNAE